jgi:ribosomal protein S12 methylthiotransferase accessory factor
MSAGAARPDDGAAHAVEDGKRFWTGTHRACAPEETLARFRPLSGRLGITRVGVITGLDTIGIPVAFAVRPQSRSISVSQGKGATVAAAKASAFMEAAETFHAETILHPCRLARAAELAAAGHLPVWREWPRLPGSRFDEHVPIPWIEAADLAGGPPALVPHEIVSTDYTTDAADRMGRHFETNTNGLASGNGVQEAINHALCELIERDAVALWMLAEGHRSAAITPETVDDPHCRWMLDRFSAAGIAVRLWDVTSDIGIPAYVCLLADMAASDTDPEIGAGCHPSPAVAAARALAEAAQARTTWIAGARDDFDPDLYAPTARRSRARAGRVWLQAAEREDFRARRDLSTPTLAGDFALLRAALRGAGFTRILAVDLTQPEIGLPVVRVFVPGLEGPPGRAVPSVPLSARAEAARSAARGRSP